MGYSLFTTRYHVLFEKINQGLTQLINFVQIRSRLA